jgi:uncharacterized protein YeaO (DUF488 family)
MCNHRSSFLHHQRLVAVGARPALQCAPTALLQPGVLVPHLICALKRAMTVHIVRLGASRAPGEGLRIGTVRHPPRGVPATRFASENWYDVWYPELAPSAEAVKAAKSARTAADWARFARRYRAEMALPAARRTLDLLAALSKTADFSVGCYCAEDARCHRSLLRELLAERGAAIARN